MAFLSVATGIIALLQIRKTSFPAVSLASRAACRACGHAADKLVNVTDTVLA
jgi:hypothetical protein